MEEPSSLLGGGPFSRYQDKESSFQHGQERSGVSYWDTKNQKVVGRDTIYDQRNTTLYFSLALLYNDKTQHYGWNRPHTYINDHQPTDAPFTTSSKASLRPNLSSSIGRTSSLSSNSCSNSITASSVSSFGSS